MYGARGHVRPHPVLAVELAQLPRPVPGRAPSGRQIGCADELSRLRLRPLLQRADNLGCTPDDLTRCCTKNVCFQVSGFGFKDRFTF